MDKSTAVFHCDNGKDYIVPKFSCLLCGHADIFWDYTNGPYLVLCSEPEGNTELGLAGKCVHFKRFIDASNW